MNNALYGIKKPPGMWYNIINSYFLNNGFRRSDIEPTLYTQKNHQGQILIVCLYVDDMIYTRNLQIEELKSVMKKELEMTKLILMKYILGIEIEQFAQGICISHHKYATNIFKRFIMNNCKLAKTPIFTCTKLSK